jgi:hypothetical protein
MMMRNGDVPDEYATHARMEPRPDYSQRTASGGGGPRKAASGPKVTSAAAPAPNGPAQAREAPRAQSKAQAQDVLGEGAIGLFGEWLRAQAARYRAARGDHAAWLASHLDLLAQDCDFAGNPQNGEEFDARVEILNEARDQRTMERGERIGYSMAMRHAEADRKLASQR